MRVSHGDSVRDQFEMAAWARRAANTQVQFVTNAEAHVYLSLLDHLTDAIDTPLTETGLTAGKLKAIAHNIVRAHLNLAKDAGTSDDAVDEELREEALEADAALDPDALDAMPSDEHDHDDGGDVSDRVVVSGWR